MKALGLETNFATDKIVSTARRVTACLKTVYPPSPSNFFSEVYNFYKNVKSSGNTYGQTGTGFWVR